MPQSTTKVKQLIAKQSMVASTELYDSLATLLRLREQRNKLGDGGNFTQADFDGGEMQHLTPAIAAGVLDLAQELSDWINDPQHPERLTLLMQIRAS